MEQFLFNNAPAVVVSGIVCWFLIKNFCIKKEDTATKKDLEGMSNRINCVAEKVSENDKKNAVEMEKQHRLILEDVSNKFTSKDTAGEIRTDVSRIEYKFEKLDEKIDTKFELLDKKIDSKLDSFMKEVLDVLSKK